ncbi:MAG: L-seryl-tRNA(Sec) selenium transferase [Bacteroidales bacterium]|nr:L-seryl-tRNA(Sec) selenium transferase [Bacteroidales bacterium]
MNSNKQNLQQLPGVDTLLNVAAIQQLIEKYNEGIVKFAIRQSLQTERESMLAGNNPSDLENVLQSIETKCRAIGENSLKPVINATGIIIHTNLGRAPFGETVTEKAMDILKGYNNLEFDLEKGSRGSRNVHVNELLKYLTGAEDVLVVNNNAAAIMLVLRTFAKNREVIISRSELIEIGGSFRLPDIMAASDCKMVEVGTTNKTRISDFDKVLSNETALLFKAHKSNFSIQGFTEEVEVEEIVRFGKKHKVPVVYDIGSGLLRKPNEDALRDEPDVKKAIQSGADIICFSGDKLLGGPQAGIIAGKKEFVQKLKKEQMTRALRVGKVTLAFLEAACRNYLDDESLFRDNKIFNLLRKSPEEIKLHAEVIQKEFADKGIAMKIVPTKAQYGGGTLPDKEIDSFALTLDQSFTTNKAQSEFSEKLYFNLMKGETPVVAILRKGVVYFDVLTVFEGDLAGLIHSVSKEINRFQSNE